MGHLVNPISFRLGVTQPWVSTWFKLGTRTTYISNLKEDLTSLKYVEYFFYYFKLLKKVDKFVLESQLEQLFYLRPSQVKRYKAKHSVASTFIRNLSLIFSHVNISRYQNNISFLIHFYDASLIFGDDGLLKFKSSIFFKSRRRRFVNSFIPIRFRSMRFKNKILYSRKCRRILDIKFALHTLVTRKNNNLKFFLFEKAISSMFRLKKNLCFNFVFVIKQLKCFFLLFSFKYFNKISVLFIVRCIIMMLYNLLISFRIYIKKYIKYFRYSFFKLFISNPKVTKWRVLKAKISKKRRFFLHKCNNLLRVFSWNLIELIYYLLLNNTFIKDRQIKRKFYICLTLSRLLYKDFKTILHFKYNNYFINFLFLNNENVTAKFLCNYFVKKLSQKYTIFEILNPVVRDLKKNPNILGFKLSCAGRLTKKQRAGLIVQRFNSVPLSTLNSIIDYSLDTVILRHGVSCVKVWLHKSIFFKPFYFSLQYKYV